MAIYALFVAHWLGDYVLQHRWMAENKSKDILALLSHVLLYTLVICLTMGQFYSVEPVLLFGALNFLAHAMIDSVSSKISGYCWKRQWLARFWWIIGFDQMLHTCTLLLTFRFFLEKSL